MQDKDLRNTVEANEDLSSDNGNYSMDINTDSDLPGTSHLKEPVKTEGEIKSCRRKSTNLRINIFAMRRSLITSESVARGKDSNTSKQRARM